jgi:hypothetical protein
MTQRISILPHLHIARPVSDLARTKDLDCRVLDLRVVGSFDDHEGFDGVMLSIPGPPITLNSTTPPDTQCFRPRPLKIW